MASSIVEHRIRLVLRTLRAAQQGTAQHSLVQHHVASHFRIAPNNLVYCMAFHYGIVHYASTAGRNSVMYSIAPCGLAQCISLVHHGVLQSNVPQPKALLNNRNDKQTSAAPT